MHERGRVAQGVVVVRFGCEVDDGVGGGHELVDKRVLADVPLDELDALGQVRAVACVGELVHDGHAKALRRLPDKIRPNEPRTASDQQTFHSQLPYKARQVHERADDRPGE